MNVYDFDGTIYDGDSSVDFYLYAIKHKPSLIRFLPKQLWGFLLYGLKRISKTELKEDFFCFLSGINSEQLVEDFWNHNQHKVFKWYLDQHQDDDLVISASPEFLLNPICHRISVHSLIASKVDAHSGKFLSQNCRGQEKVARLKEEYHTTHIDEFYSDSQSDLPLAQIANQAFFVVNGSVKKWQEV